MKRSVCLCLLLMITASAFVLVSPLTPNQVSQEGDVAEADPFIDMEFPTIWEPPYINMTLAAEGDLSSDSILSFSETTPDDVMFYPDSFFNDTERTLASSGVGLPEQYNDYTRTHDGTGALDMFGSQDTSGSPTAAYFTLNFTIPTGLYVDGWILSYRYRVNTDGTAHANNNVSIYDWESDTWDWYSALYNVNTWTNYTITTRDPDHWSTTQISIRFAQWSATFNSIGGYCQLADVRWWEMHLADSEHYAESFADVSDWTSNSFSGDDSFSTDGDVVTFIADYSGGWDYDYIYADIPDISNPAGLYFEINHQINETAGGLRVLFSDSDSSLSNYQTIYLSEPSSFSTHKFILTYGYTIRSVWLGTETGTAVDKCYQVDYLRIGPADEMGFQHDGSTTEGTTGAYGHGTITWSSDGDIVTLNITQTSASASNYPSGSIVFDTTATACDLERDYYPFFGFRYRITGTVNIGLVYLAPYMDTYTNSWALDSDGEWHTLRGNLLAMSTGSQTLKIFKIWSHYNAIGDSFEIEYDWVKAHSIANFTLSDVDDEAITDVMYVEDGVLISTNPTTDYFRLTYDPSISVAKATYPVWNATCAVATGFRFRDHGDATYYGVGETRGAISSAVMGGFQILVYDVVELSAIKFWEDAVAPTIEEKWLTPQDPDTSDDVTISIVTTDVVGVYEATATPLSEPEGSSVGTQTFTLTDTNPSGAMFWSVTIDNTDLIEGHYVFEIEVTDAANYDYEYLTFTVGAAAQTTYIRIFDSLGDFVPFETFEVYRNGSRQYTDTFEGDTESAYQIQVKDRWGESLNTTTFSAGDQELVVTVEVYSMKIMSWHYDFVRFNVTRAGLTYSEIVTPLEVINFRLYTNTYDWAIDYLNGTSTSGDITLTNSTALIVTGSTISDVLGLVTTVNTMATAINITTTTISNEVVTIQLMFDWSNTTLYNQSINIIAAFNWENTTLYNQTISIASLFNATNTVLYDQIILIQNMFNWENTTLYNQTISILNAFNATNTVIYTQTVSILADISNMNSTIYAQTVQMLLDLENSNSTLYTQTVSLLANIANIDSDIVAQTVTILADIENVNSTIYAQTVQVLTDISNMNSTIYSQTIMILNNLSDLNATVYLVDDPTHLNPLILGHSLSDDYCDLTIVTNWHNASISVYDNDVLRTGPTSELLCPIRYPLLDTAGTHNLSVFVDGSNDSFWYNISYTVAEIVAFELEDWHVTPQLGVENYLECFFRTTWGNSTIYVYLNNSLQTSILEQEGGISFGFWMTGISGLHNYVFNVTSGTNIITITWDYYLPDWADTGLVVRWDMWTFQDNYTLIMLESNWMNCTYYVYLNDSLVATSYNDPVTLNFTRAMNEGTYNLTIHAYGGNSNYTIKNIRYIVTEEGVSYDFSTVTGGITYAEGDITYEGDNVVIHENPTGMFIDQATAAIVSVGGFLIIFTAFLVAREIRKKDQEKTERLYS